MTLPAPLQWVIGTLTIWHYAVLAGFIALNLLPLTGHERQLPLPMRLWASLILPVTLYAMVALIAGQVVGDRFAWSMLWPAGLCLGALTSSMFLSTLFGATGLIRRGDARSILMLLIAVPIAATFFGLFYAAAWWIFPRVIELGGLIDFPNLAWGVDS